MRRTSYGFAIGILVLVIGSAAAIAQSRTELLTKDTFSRWNRSAQPTSHPMGG